MDINHIGRGNERKHGVGQRMLSLIAVGVLATGCTTDTVSDMQSLQPSASTPTATIAPMTTVQMLQNLAIVPKDQACLYHLTTRVLPGRWMPF